MDVPSRANDSKEMRGDREAEGKKHKKKENEMKRHGCHKISKNRQQNRQKERRERARVRKKTETDMERIDANGRVHEIAMN